MKKNEEITIEKIVNRMKQNNQNCDIDLINKAYEFASKNHKDQVRVSGEKYIIHPMNVAYILAELELDDSTIAAALLHDVVEDTPVTHKDIVNEFGEEIAEMVDRSNKTSEKLVIQQ